MSWEWKYLLTMLTVVIIANVINLGRRLAGKPLIDTSWFHVPFGFALLASPAVFLLWVLGA